MQQQQQNEPAQEQASATRQANPMGHAGKSRPYQSKQGQKPPIKARQSLVNKSDPITAICYAIQQLFAGNLNVETVNTLLARFYESFALYMQNSKAMAGQQLSLKSYLYGLETSLGTQGATYDPRQNEHLELLKDYLDQLTQKYPYPQFMVGHYASQTKAHIETFQHRFKTPEEERKLRGFRQIYVGKQSRKVLRIGYDATAAQHQLYLVDENKGQVIDQHLYPEQNQALMQDLYVGQKVHAHLLFNEIKDWTEKPGIRGIATPKESQVKGYNEVPFGLELAVSVLTPVGVMNSAYKLGTGKDLMHPEKKKLSVWEKAFAVADLVLILPLGKIIRLPGKIASQIGKQSDEAAQLLATGKQAGRDFVVEVAENSVYAERFLKAEAQLARKQAQKAEAIEQANAAYQQYKELQKAKYVRKVAKGLDGALYIKFYPSIDPKLAYQAVKVFFAELKSGSATFATWLAKLRQQKALADFIKKASEDELFGLFEAMGKIRQSDAVYQEMLQALAKNDLKVVEDLIAKNNFKSGFGSAVLKFSKIPYSSSNDLVEKVLRYRQQLGIGAGKNARSGSNVAVAEYIAKSGEVNYIIKMADSGGHAEIKIADELEQLGVPAINVKRIYSELDSCNNCTVKLTQFPKAQGFYSFELNDKGKQLWKNKIYKFYQYLKQK